jgi:putative tryptophan/tyrosine transport system substrate-binding protein
MDISTERDIDAAFPRMVEVRAGALVIFSDPFLFGRREKIVALAAANALPAIYTLREFVAAGGLMSYDTNIPDAYRQAGISMSAAFLRAKSRPTFRLSNRLNSSSSST